MVCVFFSYSHRDEDLRNELEVHLTMLKRQGVIATWHDRRIGAGQEFGKEISQHLEEAGIILLLVSPYFLASDYCYDMEMKRALERHERGEARVIPVILRPCDWHSAPFGKLLAVPKDGKPVTKYADQHDAFLEIVQAIRKVAEQFVKSAEAPAPSSPDAQASSSRSPDIRSSNLRIRKEFTDLDRDAFLQDSFEYLAKFFENSLAELQTRYPGMQTRFRSIDANHFSAAIYRGGKVAVQSRLWVDGLGGRSASILFSYNATDNDNSYNESVSVDHDGQVLFLKPLGIAGLGKQHGRSLSQQGAAEYFWAMLIERLQ